MSSQLKATVIKLYIVYMCSDVESQGVAIKVHTGVISCLGFYVHISPGELRCDYQLVMLNTTRW